MGVISLRVPEEELARYKDYARIQNQSLSAVIRATMMERIEEEYDLKVIENYEAKKAADKVELYAPDDVWAEMGV